MCLRPSVRQASAKAFDGAFLFSSGRIGEKATREASSMQAMDELPADAAAVGLAGAVAGDAMADPVETPEFLDVHVDHLARFLALVAAHRLGRFSRWRRSLTISSVSVAAVSISSILSIRLCARILAIQATAISRPPETEGSRLATSIYFLT
jgi:hypothetical protein